MPQPEQTLPLSDRLTIMKNTALLAGIYMKNSTDREHTDKSNSKDFVTIADIKAQNILREELKKYFPDEVILSEEDSEGDRELLFEPRFTGFVLDPIDGTYNFKRDMQESAISIGYIVNGEAVAGAIYDPFKNELFLAEKDKGATCNGQPIEVSNQGELAGASVATSNSYDGAAMARNLERHLAVYRQTGDMPWTSCPGSGVLIMAWVACGRIDAYHHNGLKPWDNAAAFLLVKEAGGSVQGLCGEAVKFTSSLVLLGNPKIVATIQSVFARIDAELLT